MTPSLSELKRQAIDAEAAFQEARARVMKRLAQDEELRDCTFCARAIVGKKVHPAGFYRCACSPRVIQKAARRAA